MRRLGLLLAGLLFLAACRGDGRTPVYVYSPHGREQLVLLEKMFEKDHPDLDVRWLDMGSQEILDRVRFEKPNPQCDVWFGGPSTTFDRAIGEGLLEPYRPSWAGSIDPRGIGPDSLYHAVYRTPAVLAWNSHLVAEADAPRDWDDLLAPRWKGKLLVRDPMASGTMRSIWGFIVARGIERGGGEGAGFDWLARLDAQTKSYVLNPTLLMTQLARGEGLVTLWDLPDILQARAQSLPFGWAFPSSGTIAIEDPIAIVKGARHRKAAEAFVEFVGSPPAQAAAAKEVFRLPARRDLDPATVPDWVRRVEAEMKVADVDWKLLAREGKGWMAKWDREVRGRGAER